MFNELLDDEFDISPPWNKFKYLLSIK
jgi:hypothetical protein